MGDQHNTGDGDKISSSSLVTGAVAVEGVWLAGLTYYTVTKFSELSDRVAELEKENKILKSKVSDLKSATKSNKNMSIIIKDHEKRLNKKPSLSQFEELESKVLELESLLLSGSKNKTKNKLQCKSKQKKKSTKVTISSDSESDNIISSDDSSSSSECNNYVEENDIKKMYESLSPVKKKNNKY
jgi:outer membrane murein-binding lipoprotein Lpp